jgi:probable HAF family extracellular repeat protein
MKQSIILVLAILGVLSFGSFEGKTSSLPLLRQTKPPLRYNLTLLNFWAQAINDSGQVCGSQTVSRKGPKTHQHFYEDGHLVLWKQGKLRDLGHVPETDVCIATAINSRSEIVGSMSQKGLGHGDGPPDSSHIFLWSRGRLADFGVDGQANANNDKGQIVGQKTWSHGKYGYQHGFLYTNGQLREITGAITWKSSTIDSINNSGQMVGSASVPILWEKGAATKIRLPVHCDFDAQYGPKINDAEQIIINAYTIPPVASDGHQYAHDHCYLYQNGKAADLGMLPGFTDMNGVAISNHAEIIGDAVVTGAAYKSRPFLWKHGLFYDMNDLAAHSGWIMTGASGINNRGQIIGHGQGNGREYNFLLTPITQ